MDDFYAALMSWAVTLTNYGMPVTSPEIRYVAHAYLEQEACGGRACKVLGWFPPGGVIFIDNRLDAHESLYASSIVVHEMVHFLQQSSGRYTMPYSCEDAIAMEREAYAAQQAYIVRYGVYQPIGVSMHHVNCELTAQEH